MLSTASFNYKTSPTKVIKGVLREISFSVVFEDIDVGILLKEGEIELTEVDVNFIVENGVFVACLYKV